MKIAIIQPRTSYHVAGSEKVSIKHAEHLARLGHSIDFYTSNPQGLEKSFLFKDFISTQNFKVNLLQFDISNVVLGLYKQKPKLDHNRWITESFAFAGAIFETLEQNKPDIILSYYLPDGLFKPHGVTNILYLSGYPSSSVPWYKACMPFFNATIAISAIVSNQWKENIGVGKDHFILGTGVDYPVAVKNKITPKATSNLVFAGRLSERKGVLTLLDSFSKIIEKNNNVHLWILGDGDLYDRILEKCEQLMLSNHVTVTGIVENPQDYFTMADICIFPSHKGDGLMGTVLESMANGKPVISTTKNGNEDVITSGLNGILIEPNNVEELTLAIQNLLDNPKQREILGKNAELFIKENAVWEKNVIKLNTLLEKIQNKNN